jgi:uncharacterized membrane protein
MELLAPGLFTRAIGTRGSVLARAASRVCGVREIAAGIGILTTPRPSGWVTSRVAGDLTDLGLLLAAMAVPGARRGRLLVATAAVAGVTVLDAQCAERLRSGGARPGAVRARRSITINRSAEDLYRSWRDFPDAPRFMRHVQSVRPTGDGRYHWVAKAPLGSQVEWDAEITDDQPGRLIGWRSVPGSSFENSGRVHFQPAPPGRGTEVRLEIEYTPPGREVTAQLARLIGQAPEQLLAEDLRRFKQLMETGQIVTSEGVLQGVGQPFTRRGQGFRSRAAGALSVLTGGGR